jgi:tRNA threonylcarbamoyladenosine biosynthesis protein TsaB
MKILALEFSSSHRSVAVAQIDPGAPTSVGAVILGTAHESGAGASKPFALIEAALAKANWTRDKIDTVVVGLGPGSYTGIRVAISIAQGWQLARDMKLLGISAVESLAQQARLQGLTGAIHIAIDAHRGEFYLASGADNSSPEQFRDALRLVSAEEIERVLASGETVAGPDLPFAAARKLFPDASALAELAATRTHFVVGEQLEPIYLRPISFVKAPPPRAFS